MSKAAQQSKRAPLEFIPNTPRAERGHALQSARQRKLQRYADKNGLILVGDDGGRDFRFLKRTRRPDDDVDRAGNPLPVYVERNPGTGKLFFVCRGSRKRPLPSDSTTAEFNRAYHKALRDVGEQNDLDDWTELKVLYAAQEAQRVAKLRRIAIKGIAAMLVKDRCAYGGGER